ncbi:MAG: hypothetical protein DMG07_19335 [Acidobacteria bacterium]|nr:MAG: hypothetical protein DMG07_19335 [Acidobacteriota bacterium]
MRTLIQRLVMLPWKSSDSPTQYRAAVSLRAFRESLRRAPESGVGPPCARQFVGIIQAPGA